MDLACRYTLRGDFDGRRTLAKTALDGLLVRSQSRIQAEHSGKSGQQTSVSGDICAIRTNNRYIYENHSLLTKNAQLVVGLYGSTHHLMTSQLVSCLRTKGRIFDRSERSRSASGRPVEPLGPNPAGVECNSREPLTVADGQLRRSCFWASAEPRTTPHNRQIYQKSVYRPPASAGD